jgi:hypothetical protein
MVDERGPTVPAVEEDRVGVLAAYVGTNRDRFTDGALRDAAREAGYTDTEITAAWAAAGNPAKSIPTERRTNVGVVLAVAVGYTAAIYGAGALLVSMGVGDFAAVIGLGLVVAGIVGWVVLRDSKPSLAAGLGWGVLLAVGLPIVIVLGLLGICLVASSVPVAPQ